MATKRAARVTDSSSGGLKVLLIKIVFLGLIDALAVTGAFTLVMQENFMWAGIILAFTALVNWIYLRKGGLPAKYLTPGLVFLLVFQIFAVGYTVYIGFTNYGTGHMLPKEQAIDSIVLQNQQRVPDSIQYAATVVEGPQGLGLLVTDPDGNAFVGTAEEPLEPAPDAEFMGDKAVGLNGYTTLLFADVLQRQTEVFDLAVPVSTDPTEGVVKTADGSSAFVFLSKYVYDEAQDAIVATDTGVIYSDRGDGLFVSDTGEELLPGWTITVGFENFARAFTEDSIRGPLISVLIWTIVFAFLSVALTFALGLFLAVMFNDPRMKGRRIYRVFMILPYAFPAFLSALVWSGMLNKDYGFINQVLFGGAEIPWLTDPFLAKVSVLMVNLWLGFPYMFLVTTGALQSIPAELAEAATVDGASARQTFTRIKFPLLMVSVAPLLIASFAFNFNNFNLIYMLTNGGPRDPLAGVNVGATDILISMVYKVAFGSSVRDYGLASAFTILIFLIVATISIISFRRTKTLEELN